MKKLLLLFATLCVALVAEAVEYKILDTKKRLTFVTYTVEYTSVAADGVTPAQVSGVVTVPALLSLADTDVLVLDSHHTVCDNASVPSSMGGTLACIGSNGLGLGALYPMAAPDYYGYGITRDEKHAYLSQEQNARNSIDLIPVAQDILATKHGIEPKMLFSIGYSQGGGVALAVQKLLETHDEYTDLKASFPLGVHAACGDGPYDPVATTQSIFAAAEKVELPALLPLTVNGFLSSAPAEVTEGITFADFFQPALLTPGTFYSVTAGKDIDFPGLEALIDSKEADNSGVNVAMILACEGKRGLADFFSADMLNPESDLYQRFFGWVAGNSLLNDWQPQGEVHLFHLIEDDIVTVENTYLAAEALSIPDERVHLFHAEDIGITGGDKHSQFAVHYFSDLVSVINHSLTSVTGVSIDLDLTAPCYDLQGTLVGPDYHGIVIQRGRRFIR